MSEEEFEKYLESIMETEEFQAINDFVKISEQEGTTMLEKMNRYLGYNHPIDYMKKEVKSFFEPDYDYFQNFFEKYIKKECSIETTEQGYFDLSQIPFLIQPPRFSKGRGYFTEDYLLFSNGDIYISKYPLSYNSARSGVTNTSCIYCSMIGSGIAKSIGVTTSENFLARKSDGQSRILSKNFLGKGEELVTFCEEEDIHKSLQILGKLEEALSLRHFPVEQIEEAKLEFLKQEFLAKLIGLQDQKAENTGIIVSMNESGRNVRLAPMFDYDYSFHIGRNIAFNVLESDNGKTDIESLIRQYKDYPGFMSFAKQAVDKLDMNQVYRDIYANTGIKAFENAESNETLEPFTNFVNANLTLARKTIREIGLEEREEEK